MSTRAVYMFKDEQTLPFSVYKHHDGYPSGAMEWISNTAEKAWELPRFEADEFAAAFIAANKEGEGKIRLTRGPEYHGDLDYVYTVSPCESDPKDVYVTIYNGTGKTCLDEGPLSVLKQKYK